MFKLFALCLLLTVSFTLHSTVLKYKVTKGDKTIGYFTISETRGQNHLVYQSKSNVQVSVLIQVNVFDSMLVTYTNNVLQSASLFRKVNGSVKVNNRINWVNGKYVMKDKSNTIKNFLDPIYVTTASLYFNEPHKLKYVFSENFQRMVPISRLNTVSYCLNLPNGNKTKYSYCNGICNEVVAETDWATIKFILLKS